MVVLVVDNLGVTIHQAESDAPVCLNCHRPNAFSCPLKLVQMQRWDVHVVNGLCFVKLRENQAEPFSVNRLDSSSVAGRELFRVQVGRGLASNPGLPVAGPTVLALDNQDVHQVVAFRVT
jgi:hypothetical protein